jgi:hypothetical protein
LFGLLPPDPAIRSSAGGSGLFLSAAQPVRTPPCRDTIRNARHRVLQLMYLTPQPIVWAVFRPVFHAPICPEFGAQTTCTRCLNRPSEWLFWNPFGSDRREPNTLAPNRSKARQLLDARQALVRLPESNTKYGGQRRKTGDELTPVSWASISESSGIPKPKNCCSGVGIPAAPAVHRATISWLRGVALGRLT